MWNRFIGRRRTVARIAVLALTLAGTLLPGGCDAAPEVVGPEPAAPALSGHSRGVTAWAIGGGTFSGDFFPGAPGRFAFVAVQRDAATGDAHGHYSFASTIDGQAVEIHGRITCMTVDPANPGRAWMGGVITRNRSKHPQYTGPTSQVGRESWFRVVDYGEGAHASEADRASFIFVEPTGGFTTGQAFCDARLWFPEDRLTNPVLRGNIHVRH